MKNSKKYIKRYSVSMKKVICYKAYLCKCGEAYISTETLKHHLKNCRHLMKYNLHDFERVIFICDYKAIRRDNQKIKEKVLIYHE
jgi:hypothetical protein